MNSTQNNSNEEPNAVPANEQNKLIANTHQPSLENEQAASPETTPVIFQSEPPMEVHAHTHTPRKKWTHYLWEFLMLFLAVFCGFLAENQREHYVEKQRAKNFAGTMIEDLRKDIEEVKNMNQESLVILNAFDSIKLMVHAGAIDNQIRGSFYYFSRIGSIVPVIRWNKATLTQVIQSGSLRYFTNSEMVNKISYYYALASEIDRQQETDRKFREKTVEIRNKVLNNFQFSRYSGFNISSDSLEDSLLLFQVPLQTGEPNLLNEYANSFENRRATLRNLTSLYFPDLIKTANELIEMLGKEYRLK